MVLYVKKPQVTCCTCQLIKFGDSVQILSFYRGKNVLFSNILCFSLILYICVTYFVLVCTSADKFPLENLGGPEKDILNSDKLPHSACYWRLVDGCCCCCRGRVHIDRVVGYMLVMVAGM